MCVCVLGRGGDGCPLMDVLQNMNGVSLAYIHGEVTTQYFRGPLIDTVIDVVECVSCQSLFFRRLPCSGPIFSCY